MEKKTSNRCRWNILFGIILLAVLVLFGRHAYLRYQEREAAVQAIKEREAMREASGQGDTAAQNGLLEYQGKTYRRNTAVRAILCLGIDKTGSMEKQTVSGTGGQADAIFLVAQDASADSVQILMIPRDTMTEITLFDYYGNELGKGVQHLDLSFAYGDGREQSCELMAEAVSDLLFGLKIDGYFAGNLGTIPILNDEVGGVTVTVEDPSLAERYPEFPLGETILLQGEDAVRYVRYRDINRYETALERLERQKGYIKAWLETARAKQKEDDQLIVRLVKDVETYFLTNLAKDQYMDMGLAILNSPKVIEDGDFITVPGEVRETDLYEEFYPDTEQLKEIIIRLFYKDGN